MDDDPVALKLLETVLSAKGYESLESIDDAREIESRIATAPPDLVLLDLNMPHIGGQEALSVIVRAQPDIPVIVVTAEDSIETAVECMKLGAFNFMTKPVEPNRLDVAVKVALEYRSMKRSLRALGNRLLDREIRNPEAFAEFKTVDESMINVFSYIEAIAPSDQAVLITGESGTGKELIARSVHRVSRPDRPFVAVNVAGLDDTMLSDTLFGHRKGAYTGAEDHRPGLAARAGDGVLFLDEIGDLTEQSQVKLLRLIQEREYYQLGADEPTRFHARLVAATHADLDDRVESKLFRKDLFFRLLTHRIQIPPLRERTGDIAVLIDHFLREAERELHVDRISLPIAFIDEIRGREFPGNARELRADLFDLASRMARGESAESVFGTGQSTPPSTEAAAELGEKIVRCFGRFPTIVEIERALISAAIDRSDGNQSAAAKLVGLSQSTLSRKARRGSEF